MGGGEGADFGGAKRINDKKDKHTVGLANINWNYLYNLHEEYMWCDRVGACGSIIVVNLLMPDSLSAIFCVCQSPSW